MALSDEEKLEILSDVLPELERFRMKVNSFRTVVESEDAADFTKVRAWKSVQRGSHDLRESLIHITRHARSNASK